MEVHEEEKVALMAESDGSQINEPPARVGRIRPPPRGVRSVTSVNTRQIQNSCNIRVTNDSPSSEVHSYNNPSNNEESHCSNNMEMNNNMTNMDSGNNNNNIMEIQRNSNSNMNNRGSSCYMNNRINNGPNMFQRGYRNEMEDRGGMMQRRQNIGFQCEEAGMIQRMISIFNDSYYTTKFMCLAAFFFYHSHTVWIGVVGLILSFILVVMRVDQKQGVLSFRGRNVEYILSIRRDRTWPDFSRLCNNRSNRSKPLKDSALSSVLKEFKKFVKAFV